VDAFGVALTVVVLLGVAVFILLFERRRAARIERDLKDASRQRRNASPADES
jgi:hypothetical protein